MATSPGPRRSVAHWLAQARAMPSNEQLCRAFEAAFGALWRRAFLALGEITLGAVLDRVHRNACDRWPVLKGLEVDARGLHCAVLVKTCDAVPPAELAEGFGSLLTEFLGVLGSLTAEILTPALDAELARATRELVGAEAAAPADRPAENSEDEGTES